MKKTFKVVLAVLALWVSAGIAEAATPIFNQTASQLSLQDFRTFFTNEQVLEGDDVLVAELGQKLHSAFEPQLNEAAAMDPKSIANALVEQFGEKLPIGEFYELAKASRIVLPDTILKTVSAPAVQPAVASAPQATPAPAAVVQAPPPVVTPATVSVETVAQVARDEVAGALKALGVVNRRTEELQQQLAAKAGEVARLERELQATKATGAEAAATTAAALEAAEADLAQLRQYVPEAAQAAAAAAVKPVAKDVASLKGDVTKLTDSVIFTYGNWIHLTAAGALMVAISALSVGVANGRKARRALTAANEAKTGVAKTHQVINGLVSEVASVDERVTAVAEQAGLTVKDVTFLREVLLGDLRVLPKGGTCTHGVQTVLMDGRKVIFEVTFTRQNGDYVTVEGMRDQTQPLKIENVPVRLKRAGFKGQLLKVTGVTDEDGLAVLKAA